jgi:hypothetical protein
MGGQLDIKAGKVAMYFRVILSAAGLAVAFSLAPGQAEVVSVNSTFAINGMATIGDPPIVSGDIDVAGGALSGDFEVQSAPIVSRDTFDLDRGTLAVTVVPELSTWATTLLSLTGFGR